MIEKLRNLLANRVVKNISLASFGTLVSQGLFIAALPVLTRLYAPSDFALLAIYTSLIGLFVVIACGRFDIAIPLPETDFDGALLLLISLVFAALFSLVLFFIYLFFGPDLLEIFSLSEFSPYVWLVPLGVFFAASNSCLEYWFARVKRFGFMAKTKVARATMATGSQVGIGHTTQWPGGLIAGQIVFAASGAVIQFTRFLLDSHKMLRLFSIDKLRRVAGDYMRFPLLSGPEAVFNKIGVHVPVLIIAGAEGPEAGFLMIAMRILAVPISLLGVSVQQVYLSEAPEKYREGTLRQFTLQLQLALFRVGALPLLLLGALAPLLAVPVFGPGWEGVGLVILWLTPSYFLQFIVSPISVVLHVVNKTGYAALLQFWGALVRAGSVIFAGVFYPEYAVEIYAVSGVVFYLSYLVVVDRSLHKTHLQ